LTGDQIYFWTDGQRMLFGELPYRDFFQFTPPGTDFLYLALFKLFGPHIWVTNLMVLTLGIALSAAGLSVAQQIMPRVPARLAMLVFLTAVYGKLLNATHHWFSLFLILCAARVSMARTTSRRIAVSGILLGAAAFFTHTHAMAALLAFIVVLAWQSTQERQALRIFLQRLTLFVLAFAGTWFLCVLPFLATVGIKQLLYYQFTFVRRYMAHTQGAFLGLPETLALRHLPQLTQYLIVYALVVVTYPVCLWQCWVHRRDCDRRLWNNVALLTLLGSLLALEVAFGLSWLRVYVVALPAVVLAIFWIDKMRMRNLTKTIWAAAMLLAVFQTASKLHRYYIVADLPAGRAALSPATAEKFAWISRHTQPSDFFLEALQPTVYFPLGLRSPIYAEGLTPLPLTRPEFIQLAIRQLESKPVPYILWSHYLNDAQNNSISDPLATFRDYLSENYRIAHTFSDRDEVWQKK
jgi:hypothetical protein